MKDYLFISIERWIIDNNEKTLQALNQKENRTGIIKSSLKRIDYSNAQSNEESLLKDEYDLNPDNLQIQNILGSGAYGIVRLGLLQDNTGKLIKVAVKTLKGNTHEHCTNRIQWKNIAIFKIIQVSKM